MIHKSWKRIEILNIIDKLGLYIKEYSYLNKHECFTKFGQYIIDNDIKELEYLFSTKPVIHIPMAKRSILTRKAKKICVYCENLDLEICGYTSIIQVKDDVNIIKEYQFVPCIRKAVDYWNAISDEKIPYDQEQLEYELSIQDEKLIRKKLCGLTIKKGTFNMDFS